MLILKIVLHARTYSYKFNVEYIIQASSNGLSGCTITYLKSDEYARVELSYHKCEEIANL